MTKKNNSVEFDDLDVSKSDFCSAAIPAINLSRNIQNELLNEIVTCNSNILAESNNLSIETSPSLSENEMEVDVLKEQFQLDSIKNIIKERNIQDAFIDASVSRLEVLYAIPNPTAEVLADRISEKNKLEAYFLKYKDHIWPDTEENTSNENTSKTPLSELVFDLPLKLEVPPGLSKEDSDLYESTAKVVIYNIRPNENIKNELIKVQKEFYTQLTQIGNKYKTTMLFTVLSSSMIIYGVFAVLALCFETPIWYSLGESLGVGQLGSIFLSMAVLIFSEALALKFWMNNLRRKYTSIQSVSFPFFKPIAFLIILNTVLAGINVYLDRKEQRLFAAVSDAKLEQSRIDMKSFTNKLSTELGSVDSLAIYALAKESREVEDQIYRTTEKLNATSSLLDIARFTILLVLGLSLLICASMFLGLFHLQLSVFSRKRNIKMWEKKKSQALVKLKEQLEFETQVLKIFGQIMAYKALLIKHRNNFFKSLNN